MYTYKYPRPAVTVDAVVFCRRSDSNKVLLIQRKHAPYKDYWAFPGGFINIDETAEDAVCRELNEETCLRLNKFIQLGAYSRVDRDPRGRVISIVFCAIVDEELPICGADDAADAQWFDLNSLPSLAFDHNVILTDALAKVKFLL